MTDRVLVVLPRATKEARHARRHYELHGHGSSFFAELEATFEALRAMPLRFPSVQPGARRATLRKYPYLVFFQVREPLVVVLAVVHQRGNPADWPRGR